MAGLSWYKRDPVAFLNGTVGMVLEEKGAYSIVLDLIYAHGGPVRDDPRWLAGNCGCSVRRWSVIRDRLLELGKVYIPKVGFISNSRADFELEKSSKPKDNPGKSQDNIGENERDLFEAKDLTPDTRVRASARREDKIREDKKDSLPSGESVNGADERSVEDVQFDTLWGLYPRKVAKPRARKMFARALKRAPYETILQGVHRYVDQVRGKDPQHIAHFASWLNDDRWADEPERQPPARNGGNGSTLNHERSDGWSTRVAKNIAASAEGQNGRQVPGLGIPPNGAAPLKPGPIPGFGDGPDDPRAGAIDGDFRNLGDDQGADLEPV